MQAGACSIRSRLRRSHGWLCSVRSCLRHSHSALLIHYKKVELKKKVDLHGIRICICQSRVGCVITTAHWTISFTENKCSIYYQLCLGCGLQECRWSFGKNRLHPRIQSAVDGEQLGLRHYKTNFVFPEDGRFISSKFDMDPCTHGEDPLDQKNADGRTDGFSALYSRLLLLSKNVNNY